MDRKYWKAAKKGNELLKFKQKSDRTTEALRGCPIGGENNVIEFPHGRSLIKNHFKLEEGDQIVINKKTNTFELKRNHKCIILKMDDYK